MIFREKASGGRWDRPELHRLLDQLREGDILVVWRLDRLSRSLRDVLTIMERINEAKTGFRSLTEAIDTREFASLGFASSHGSPPQGEGIFGTLNLFSRLGRRCCAGREYIKV
jgi:hypothetical protein